METIIYLALGLGLFAVFQAWRNGRKAVELQARLDSLNNRYFSLSNQIREREETTQQGLLDLKVEMKRQAGLLKFEPQMTIQEIYDMHPQAVNVLAGFHLGGCSSCAVQPEQTLSAATQQHNLNLPMIMGALKQLADGKAAHAHAHFQTDPDLRIIA